MASVGAGGRCESTGFSLGF